LALLGLFAQGHVLLEDLPGVGKALLAKTIAGSIDGRFSRIQFTPDLLPGDITGSSVFDSGKQLFSFVPGPIFANVVVADELNRTGPRTQSALLEAMAEGSVSSDGEVWQLPRPFLVIATQNLIETYGTFPLPNSQLDRFMISMELGLPTPEEEMEILRRSQQGSGEIRHLLSQADVGDLWSAAGTKAAFPEKSGGNCWLYTASWKRCFIEYRGKGESPGKPWALTRARPVVWALKHSRNWLGSPGPFGVQLTTQGNCRKALWPKHGAACARSENPSEQLANPMSKGQLDPPFVCYSGLRRNPVTVRHTPFGLR